MATYYYIGDETSFDDPNSWSNSPDYPASGSIGFVPGAGDTVYIDGANITDGAAGQFATLIVSGAYQDMTERVGGLGLNATSVTDITGTVQAASTGAGLQNGAVWTNTSSLDDESDISVSSGSQLADQGSDTVGATSPGAEVDVDGAGSVYSVAGVLTDDGFIGATNGASLQFGAVSGTGGVNVGGLTSSPTASSATLGAVTLNSLSVSSASTVTATSLNLSTLQVVSGSVTAGGITITSGQITASGTSSSIDDTGALSLGGGADTSASVTVSQGATLTLAASSLVLGSGGGSAMLTLTGTASTLGYSGSLAIGTDGFGSFQVGTLASYVTAGAVTLGEDASGSGSLSASGTGAALTVSGRLTVGADGGGFAGASSGGTLTVRSLDAGLDADSTDDTVFTNGTAALFDVVGDAIIGDGGKAAAEVENGGTFVVAGTAVLGAQAGSSGQLFVSNGTWDSLGSLDIGGLGTGQLKITGGTVDQAGGTIGADGNGSVLVYGTSSTWNDSGNLVVGDGSAGNIDLEAGGSIAIGGSLTAGADADITGDLAVDGTGSSVTVHGPMLLGALGTGMATVEDGATLTNAGALELGTGADGSGDLTEEGPYTFVSVESILYDGLVARGAIDVEDGATLDAAGSVELGSGAGASGDLTADGSYTAVSFDSLLYDGKFGRGAIDVADGATLTAGGTVELGSDTGGSGTLTADGSYTVVTFDSLLYDGLVARGMIDVDDGATLDARNAVELGSNDGSDGTLTAEGSYTVVTFDSLLYAGKFGNGTIDVAGGATLDTVGSVELGSDSGGDGILTADGSYTVVTFDSLLYAGKFGNGTIDVLGGATLDTIGSVELGSESGASGTVTIDGPYTAVSFDSLLYDGKFGKGAIDITDDATLKAGDTVDVGVDGSGSLSVDNSRLEILNVFNIAVNTDGTGDLQIDDHAVVMADDLLYDGLFGHGTIDLSDSSTLMVGSTLQVGAGGSGSLAVMGGSTLAITSVFIDGVQVGGTGDVTVTGNSSVIIANDVVQIGQAGGGTLQLSDGAQLKAGNTVDLGVTGSGNATAMADGQDTSISSTGLMVGDAGTAGLTISDGAQYDDTGAIAVGAQAGGDGTLVVTGDGSELEGTSADVGGADDAGGGTGTLTVSDGATITVSGNFGIWQAGAADVSEDGSELRAQTISITGDDGAGGTGALVIGSGGSVAATEAITLASGGSIDASGGGEVTIGGAGLMPGSGTIDIGTDGTLSGDGTASGVVDASGLLEAGGAGALAIVGELTDDTQRGTAALDDGATLDLSQSGSNAVGTLDIGSGAALTVTNVVTVYQDYFNADFETGNDFDAHAGLSGGGTIMGDGAALAIIGADVSGGASSDPVLTFTEQADGLETASFSIENSGVGATVIGAIETTGLTSGAVSGLTAGNFTLAAGGASDIYTLTYDPSGGDLDGQVIGIESNFDNVASITISLAAEAPCFARGTRIRTPRGDVPVETLVVGDEVMTVHGTAAPVRWLGHRRVDCTRHPAPDRVWPVRVESHAFGPGRPARTLLLSPDHAVHADQVLIPIKHLINGRSITQVHAADIEYWHVELDCHDILLAEGLPVESYLDTGNRSAFANGGVHVALYADFAARSWNDACAELVEDGPRLVAVKRRLFAHAGIEERAPAPTLLVLANGQVLDPTIVAPQHWRFTVPEGVRALNLVSDPWTPASCLATSLDRRVLGARLFGVTIGDQAIDLDAPALFSGFHPAEMTAEGMCCWTDGNARLVVPARGVDVVLNVGPEVATPGKAGYRTQTAAAGLVDPISGELSTHR